MNFEEKLIYIAEREQKVYDAGKQAEYDRQWDTFQQNGNRNNYTFGFAGQLWNADTFYPKYDITIGAGNSTFYYSDFSGSLKERLEQQGVTMTFPNTSQISNLFNNASKITELGVLDFSTVAQKAPSGVFNACSRLHTIEKLVLPPTFTSYSSWFSSCSALKNLTIEGVITNNISFSPCPLTHESLMSIINALMYVGHTFTKTSTVVEPAGFADSTIFPPGSPAYTTTGEKVLFGYTSDWTWMGHCCLVDGVYYAVTEAKNTATYTLTLSNTHKDPSNPNALTDEEIAIAIDKGWNITWN